MQPLHNIWLTWLDVAAACSLHAIGEHSQNARASHAAAALDMEGSQSRAFLG